LLVDQFAIDCLLLPVALVGARCVDLISKKVVGFGTVKGCLAGRDSVVVVGTDVPAASESAEGCTRFTWEVGAGASSASGGGLLRRIRGVRRVLLVYRVIGADDDTVGFADEGALVTSGGVEPPDVHVHLSPVTVGFCITFNRVL